MSLCHCLIKQLPADGDTPSLAGKEIKHFQKKLKFQLQGGHKTTVSQTD